MIIFFLGFHIICTKQNDDIGSLYDI